MRQKKNLAQRRLCGTRWWYGEMVEKLLFDKCLWIVWCFFAAIKVSPLDSVIMRWIQTDKRRSSLSMRKQQTGVFHAYALWVSDTQSFGWRTGMESVFNEPIWSSRGVMSTFALFPVIFFLSKGRKVEVFWPILRLLHLTVCDQPW